MSKGNITHIHHLFTFRFATVHMVKLWHGIILIFFIFIFYNFIAINFRRCYVVYLNSLSTLLLFLSTYTHATSSHMSPHKIISPTFQLHAPPTTYFFLSMQLIYINKSCIFSTSSTYHLIMVNPHNLSISSSY